MPKFAYTVWFENAAVPADDQHREWPACFDVDAMAMDEAKSLGSIWEARTGFTPTVLAGQMPTRAEIGW